MLNEECKGISPLSTAKVLENAFGWNNKKRRRLFVGKRTQCLVILPRFLQGDKITDHIDDIDPAFDFFYSIARNHVRNLNFKDTFLSGNQTISPGSFDLTSGLKIKKI